ncbi:MAG: hypothetical protein PHO30_04725 [Candidatus Omnitrophica bacterium]|nr:hypothetical protein [Candidatus Omnitrophota bacterium]
MKNYKLWLGFVSFWLVQQLCLGSVSTAACRAPEQAALSPQIAVDGNGFRDSYALQELLSRLNNSGSFPLVISPPGEVSDYVTIINRKTTNFRIAEHNFRLPPYTAGRLARMHITDVGDQGFTLQKLGIGKGRRQPTKAVVLADVNDIKRQLLVFVFGKNAILKRLDNSENPEIISLGRFAQFDALQRQDSFLERSRTGREFIDEVLGISGQENVRAKQIVRALRGVSADNPKLERDLPIDLAFFSQDYMIVFPRELVNNSYVSILRDREQRGRFLAVVDRMNPDNYVVFERRDDEVILVGKTPRTIISRLKKQAQTQAFYFTDFPEAAAFCRAVSRNLGTFSPSESSSSFSLRLGVTLHFGADNRDVKILKVKQVTQSTPTGYQVKQRQPDFEEPTLAEYPLYVLKAGFREDISLSESAVKWGDPRFLFFDVRAVRPRPRYLGYTISGEQNYYQMITGEFSHQGKSYIVYRRIEAADVHTRLYFRKNNEFTISGINWKNGTSVVFRDLKQISLPNIVTQLQASRFIDVSADLTGHFTVREIIGTPYRTTYHFSGNRFEQSSPTVFMDSPDQFARIQQKEDDKIAVYATKADIGGYLSIDTPAEQKTAALRNIGAFITARLQQQGIINKVLEQWEGGKQALPYLVEYQGGPAILKILPLETGIRYGTAERVELMQSMYQYFEERSPLARPYAYIEFPDLGHGVIIEEVLGGQDSDPDYDDWSQESAKMNARERADFFRALEIKSLLRIWWASRDTASYPGAVIEDLVLDDIRYLKINGEWVAKFVDGEERSYFSHPADMAYFYSQIEQGYSPELIARTLITIAGKTGFADLIAEMDSARSVRKLSEIDYPLTPILEVFKRVFSSADDISGLKDSSRAKMMIGDRYGSSIYSDPSFLQSTAAIALIGQSI